MLTLREMYWCGADMKPNALSKCVMAQSQPQNPQLQANHTPKQSACALQTSQCLLYIKGGTDWLQKHWWCVVWLVACISSVHLPCVRCTGVGLT